MSQLLQKMRPHRAKRLECSAYRRLGTFTPGHFFGIWRLSFVVSVSLFPFWALTQAPLPVYSDRLVNGFQNWGWATLDYANASPVHSGNSSVAITMAAYQGQQVYHPDLNSSN